MQWVAEEVGLRLPGRNWAKEFGPRKVGQRVLIPLKFSYRYDNLRGRRSPLIEGYKRVISG